MDFKTFLSKYLQKHLNFLNKIAHDDRYLKNTLIKVFVND